MSDQVKASHILLMYEGSMRSSADRSKEEALSKIQELEQALSAGGDFGELAKENSDCPSGARGGDLGEFSRGQMVPAFDEAVFGMDVGATSGIVETDFGYHLIHRTG
ncbi:MAG: parvulin peptidyl-prolyl isomerase [Rhodospirillales bacterium]|jgi:parvulin-like peptidyl-prolyl isomerase|nr:parvulin peptidyl-prolyl isomerase [Rhodospirillales bacterium]MBT4007543.1 parvulin peptidyl-prolyl isomerase [Rhodospirillales bacterium]MBT5076326.1 parvulin peptidyl-prolyl isomerase [Rhodospirillales bacterium]MBT5113257.1 parvulin peptidyl-prolyl isomerase [Rhodospirillales bacterium]MBT5671890.1 parvulin peptidyl-prolyl isomerase [Rhodospirillales bacterium]